MKKVVLQLYIHDDKVKQKAMKTVSGLSAVDSISMDMKEKKLTVTGDVDPVAVVSKLRKLCDAALLTVEPAKVSEKKKGEPKKQGNKKTDENKADTNYPYIPPRFFVISAEEDPNACVMC